MNGWNFAAAIYDLGASELADRAALIHEDQTISYGELRRRALGIASYLTGLGLEAGSHVGHYLRNSNAYLETFVGAGLAGMSHVNVNYRYRDRELAELCNSLDIRVLVYDAEFADTIDRIRPHLSKTRCFICVGKGVDVNLASLYDWPVEDTQHMANGDDLILIATGGTTGLPKGVMWRHEDLWYKQGVSTGMAMQPLQLESQPANMAEHLRNVSRLPVAAPFLALSPLMHGAGFLIAIMLLAQGVPVATLGTERFEADHALDTIARIGVVSLVLVGDAFAVPLLDALDCRRCEALLSSLQLLISSGAALSRSSRERLLEHRPGLVIVDSLGSSETSGYAMSTPEPGVFVPLPTTRVLSDDLKVVPAGSERIGMVYTSGYLPQGYYNAPEETANTFLEIDGRRYVRTGDRCSVREDGMLVLLGRDSSMINTGGEKVYTVEVERVLLEYPGISDALVVSLPHERFGCQVVAVVEGPGLDQSTLDSANIQKFAATQLADYKVPRKILAIDSLQRGPNGKPDYPMIQTYAERCLN